MIRKSPAQSRAISTTPIAETDSTAACADWSALARPQEWHADLGLVDDDNTEDMRVVDRCPGCVRVWRVQPCFPGCGSEGMFLW